jgi:hypothetical protein
VEDNKKSANNFSSNIYVIDNTLFLLVNMYPMKRQFLTGCLLTGLVCLPLELVSQTQVLANDSILQVAQTTANYDQNMRRGYTETGRRNYRLALSYFQQALKLRPNDMYAQAAIRNVNSYLQQRRQQIAFVPGRPGRLRAAASRGTCFLNGKSAIALIPTSQEAQLTTSKNPTLFFYVPQTAQPIQGLELTLRDDESVTPVYKKTFKSVKQGGIVSIPIPAEEAALTTGKEYTWGFSLVCDFRSRDQDLYLEGKIEVVEDDNITHQIEQTTQPLDQAVLYATAGLWENSLSILADLRRQRPNDFQVRRYWTELLQSVELQEVSNQPFLPCCIAENRE